MLPHRTERCIHTKITAFWMKTEMLLFKIDITRVIPTCAVTGEASGTAAAFIAKNG